MAGGSGSKLSVSSEARSRDVPSLYPVSFNEIGAHKRSQCGDQVQSAVNPDTNSNLHPSGPFPQPIIFTLMDSSILTLPWMGMPTIVMTAFIFRVDDVGLFQHRVSFRSRHRSTRLVSLLAPLDD